MCPVNIWLYTKFPKGYGFISLKSLIHLPSTEEEHEYLFTIWTNKKCAHFSKPGSRPGPSSVREPPSMDDPLIKMTIVDLILRAKSTNGSVQEKGAKDQELITSTEEKDTASTSLVFLH
ncbi:hypothetical protein PHYBLDRAFT_165821 [Phycomyces blakesleeanus NRRL 1555(-)]|uniref:Uncharacterized protein n=1 Tax=Phycomyces blakesleeanus (strain ATCC 8743b / DSM 1359 / FGSC 10004 / NBRC 33097 / NRRL 1555) TaxID=763407 RepID=A0A163AU60_PHYB8|nr:hypothetical protein PHYBLDRAFT_165821 [Phycomyces blakesleeanus NRRL 1555(-)]OAD75841.1 hypothetical protein PHYBLDRAFT_165821 [Phycomyces blakesleeanus NRRL 1555(-)]|eukprot:XP_018293881.1 hypothetical protein PHYBLDRAFT_165821 [Phycomyces blakesleeanus NRRL 1555(-)]